MNRILIIDDDEMQLNMLTSTLASEGYQIYATADGPQGIFIFKEQRPDLVLLDIGLPSMSGLDVLREIRELDPNAKVMVITGYGSVESVVLTIRSGACDFIHKPYNIEMLLKKIESTLNASSPIS